MSHYLLQVAYTPEAAAALVKNPQNRLEAVRPVAKRLGGTVDSQWMSLGEVRRRGSDQYAGRCQRGGVRHGGLGWRCL